MNRRAWLGVVAGVGALVAAYFGWDALVITDEERLERLVEDVRGPIGATRMQGHITRWVDLDRQPLELSVYGQPLFYAEGDDAALAERAAAAVRELRGVQINVLSSGIAVEGDEANVQMRLLSRERGMSQAAFRLQRHGDAWLVERLAVTR